MTFSRHRGYGGNQQKIPLTLSLLPLTAVLFHRSRGGDSPRENDESPEMTALDQNHLALVQSGRIKLEHQGVGGQIFNSGAGERG